MLGHDISLTGSDHSGSAAPLVLAQHGEGNPQRVQNPDCSHSQSLLAVGSSAACEVYYLPRLLDLDILGHPAESILLLGHVGIPICFDQLGEHILLSNRSVASGHQVWPHGLPEFHRPDARLADSAAYAAGGAAIGILSEDLHLVVIEGLGSEDLGSQAMALGHQLSPAGVLVHGGDARAVRPHSEGGAPLHALLTAVAAIYLHELGGQHKSRHQGLGILLISHCYSPPLLAIRVMGVAMTWIYLLQGNTRANRPMASTV